MSNCRGQALKVFVLVAAVCSVLLFFSEHVIQVIGLSLIQGITEFLPVSSSAHLVLFPRLTDWPDQGLAFDCVVHLGTLTAVVMYFWQDIFAMYAGFVRCIQKKSLHENIDGKLLFFVLLATIPVGLAGLAFKDFIETDLRSLTIIAWASIGFGVLLWLADWLGTREKSGKKWTLVQSLCVGCAQALALIPGTSRSGITMTAALFLGFSRQAAARFSFLLAIPVIFLAALLKIKDWIEQPQTYMNTADLLLGFLLSAIAAYYCIRLFLGLIERAGVLPFVIYRIALGLFLLMMV